MRLLCIRSSVIIRLSDDVKREEEDEEEEDAEP
jgi:hypothetical protein